MSLPGLPGNARHAVPETTTSGYNETTTRAFMHLIAATLHAYSQTHPTTDADSFYDTHPQLMTRHALRLFYSPQRRMDPAAKMRYVEPDLAPLPVIKEDGNAETEISRERGWMHARSRAHSAAAWRRTSAVSAPSFVIPEAFPPTLGAGPVLRGSEAGCREGRRRLGRLVDNRALEYNESG